MTKTIHELKCDLEGSKILIIKVREGHFGGQGQLTVKGSSKRMLPQFKEPILGQVRLRFNHSFRGTFYRQLPLIRHFIYYVTSNTFLFFEI